jgi:hypothetical protein
MTKHECRMTKEAENQRPTITRMKPIKLLLDGFGFASAFGVRARRRVALESGAPI